MYVCERCGSKFNSARFAKIEVCPRCMLRDDVAAHLVYLPGGSDAPAADTELPEPSPTSTDLG